MDLNERIQNVAKILGRAAAPEFEFIENYISELESNIKEQSQAEIDACNLPIPLVDENNKSNFSQKKHKVILGEPGSGKSIMLQKDVIDKAKKFQEGNLIPAYIKLSDYQGSNLEEFVFRQILAQDLQNSQFDFYFDGLDECNTSKVTQQISNSLLLLKNNITIACRPNVYHKMPGFQELAIKPIERQNVIRYMEKQLGKDYDRDLVDLCTNPLLLNFTLQIHKKTNKIKATSKTHLYEQITELFFQREEGAGKSLTLINKKLDIFSKIAYHVQAVNGTGKLSRGELESIIESETSGSDEYKNEVWKEIESNNILHCQGNEYEFALHKTIQEYFCAREMSSLFKKKKISIAQIWNLVSYVEDRVLWRIPYIPDEKFRAVRPAWETTLSFLASMIGTSKIVKELLVAYDEIKNARSYFPLTAEGLDNLMKLPSYNYPQDYNPFLSNLFLTVELMDQDPKTRKGLTKKILKEISSKGSIIRYFPIAQDPFVKNDRDFGRKIRKKLFKSNGYNSILVDFVADYEEIFDVDLDKDGFEFFDKFTADKLAKAAEKKIYEKDIEDNKFMREHGKNICQTLKELNSPDCNHLLAKIQKDFDSYTLIYEFFEPPKSEIFEKTEIPYSEMKKQVVNALKRGEPFAQIYFELHKYDTKDIVDFVMEECIPANPERALHHLWRMSDPQLRPNYAKYSKQKFFEYVNQNPDIRKEIETTIIMCPEPIEYSDADELIKFYEESLSRESGYFYVWPNTLAKTKNNKIIDTLLNSLNDKCIHRTNIPKGLAALNTMEAYLALVNCIKDYENYCSPQSLVEALGEFDDLEYFEKTANTSIIQNINDYCMDHGISYTKKSVSRIGNIESLNILEKLLSDKDRVIPRDSEVLETITPLCLKLKKEGIEIPSDLYMLIIHQMESEGKILPWFDDALTAIGPKKYLNYALNLIPANYDHKGITPLYAAIKRVHTMMKPKSYK